MNSFYFEYSYFLISIPIYIFIIIYFTQKEQSYYIPNIVDTLKATKKHKSIKNILKHFSVIFAILALSSPIQIQHQIDKNKHTLEIVLNIDTSGSMSLNGLNELDYNQTRLDVVKSVVKDFIHKRKKDTIGLVVFGNRSSVASPLSYNNEVTLNIIKKLTIGVVGKSTALIDSIVQATQLLKNGFSSSKLIILLSDGDDTASKVPLEIALSIAKKEKIKIYTIAIGESNNNLLELISRESGAKSFIATNKKDLQKVYKSITQLEATTHNIKKIKIIHYLYKYPLYLALLCIFIIAILVRKNEEL